MLTLIFLAVTACLIYYYFKRKLTYFEDRGIPSAPAWPFLGNMYKAFFRRQHFSDLMVDLYTVLPGAKYIGAFDFVRPVFVIRDPELIKAITIKNFDNFPDHKTFFTVDMDPYFGSCLFSLPGDRWREMRNILSPAFTSSKMKCMYKLMLQCAERYLSYIDDLPNSSRRRINTKDFCTRFCSDLLASCSYGFITDSLNDPKNELFEIGKKATNFEGIITLKYFIARSFPWFMKWFNIRFLDNRTVTWIENMVNNTMKMRDEKGISGQDMIQLMMDARGKTTGNLKMDSIEMTAQAGNFFFGGYDTTSTHMAALAHELAVNPDIQKRLQEEIDDVMEKSSGKPTYEDIHGMEFLEACFQESIRRHTTAIHLDRVCEKPFELPPAQPGAKPFTLQPGMSIWIPTSGIHMDPKIFKDPKKFDPNRYYERRENICGIPHLGFGIGPRACIGIRFAVYETKILFCLLLSKYNLVPNKKTCIPLKYNKASFTIKPVGGFWLALEARSSK